MLVPSLESVNGKDYLAVQYRRLLLAYEVTYSFEVSADLVHWQPAAGDVGQTILNPDGTQTVTFHERTPVSSSGSRFVRLSISRVAR